MLFRKKNKEIIFCAGIEITDRPERWAYPFSVFKKLANLFKKVGIDSQCLCHPAVATRRPRPTASEICHSLEQLENTLQNNNFSYGFIWGGNSPADILVRELFIKYNIQPVFVELGWFPQSETIYLDFQGTNANSSIQNINIDNLIISPELSQWMINYKQKYLSNIKEDYQKDYIFVPLQDERDMNIIQASPYKTMKEFVRDVVANMPEEQIIVRKHPHFMDVELDEHINVIYDNNIDYFTQIYHAKAVVSINSTILLESLLFDKTIYSCGTHLASGLNIYNEVKDFSDYNNFSDENILLKRKKFLSEIIFRRMLRVDELKDKNILQQNHVLETIYSSLQK